ncbi:MAG: hypothetical protein B6I18_04060 [Bacteroidetes bacterium 4572_112]|nr:MAG: hypothetical protein B6I18_04060 [Bacteroidetes bacterium 4572_112]
MIRQIFVTIIGLMLFTIVMGQNGESVKEFKKAPYLLFNKDNSSMRVIWQANNNSVSIISLYDNKDEVLSTDTVANTTSDFVYIYDFKNLDSQKEYKYKVKINDESKIGSFYSRPTKSIKSFSFIAYGDTRTNPQDHDKVCKQMLQQIDAERSLQTFIISTGDLVSNGDKEDVWQEQFFDDRYTNISKLLASLPYMTSMGNHEGQGELFAKYFPYDLAQNNRFYYSFKYGNAQFIAVDQFTKLKAGSKQYVWLENELKASKSKWKIILIHKPGYTAGGHRDNKIVKNTLQPLFKKYNVNLVLAGHNHYYARAEVNGITHITTGGGGAPLYTPKQKHFIEKMDKSNHFLIINVDENTMEIKSIRADGSIIENISINN